MVESQKVGVQYSRATIPSVCYHTFFGSAILVCLTNLHFSYGNPSQLPSVLKKEYSAFAQHFVTTFAPEIFKIYLQQVQNFVSNQVWLSKKCQYQIFVFFTEWFVFFFFTDRRCFKSLHSIVLNQNQPGNYSSLISSHWCRRLSFPSYPSPHQSKSSGMMIRLISSAYP
jgi:hypothetical protein